MPVRKRPDHLYASSDSSWSRIAISPTSLKAISESVSGSISSRNPSSVFPAILHHHLVIGIRRLAGPKARRLKLPTQTIQHKTTTGFRGHTQGHYVPGELLSIPSERNAGKDLPSSGNDPGSFFFPISASTSIISGVLHHGYTNRQRPHKQRHNQDLKTFPTQ